MQPGSNGGNRLDADALWAYALGGDSDTDTRGAAWALVCACRISAESRCREAWQDITRDTATAAARSFYECLRYSTSAEVPREESPDDEPTPRVLLHLSIFYGNISVATRVQSHRESTQVRRLREIGRRHCYPTPLLHDLSPLGKLLVTNEEQEYECVAASLRDRGRVSSILTNTEKVKHSATDLVGAYLSLARFASTEAAAHFVFALCSERLGSPDGPQIHKLGKAVSPDELRRIAAAIGMDHRQTAALLTISCRSDNFVSDNQLRACERVSQNSFDS